MKKYYFSILTLIYTLLFTPKAYAEAQKIKGSGCVDDGTVTFDCLPILFVNTVYWLVALSGTVALFMVIFGGYQLLTSAGVPQKVEQAKKTITFAIIGLVMVFLSFFITNLIADFTGVSCGFEFNDNNDIDLNWCS